MNSSMSNLHRKSAPEIVGLQRHVLSIKNPVQLIEQNSPNEDIKDTRNSTQLTNNENFSKQDESTRINMKYISKNNSNKGNCRKNIYIYRYQRIMCKISAKLM